MSMSSTGFDLIAVVDWSAAASPGPVRPKKDRVWLAWGTASERPPPVYCRTRNDCLEHLEALVRRTGGNALVAWDFPFGYPAESGLGGGREIASRLAELIEDGPRDRNNRFAVADGFNRALGSDSGPFWARPASAAAEAVPERKPDFTRFAFPEWRIVERHARQQAARTMTGADWDGTWLAAVVTGERRSASDRAAFREVAARLHLAEIREGLWMRPDDRPGTRDGHPIVDAQATWFRTIRPDDPDVLVAAFGLDAWAERARALLDEIRRWQPALDRHDVAALGETFVVDADVLRHLVADPELPATLLPPEWPGPAIREAFAAFDRAFKATWRDWYQSFQTS